MTAGQGESRLRIDPAAERSGFRRSADPAIRYLWKHHERIVGSRSVRHPFLVWYQSNKLTKQQQRVLFSECYYWFQNLPAYILGFGGLTTDTNVLAEVVKNAHSELCDGPAHSDLYKAFLRHIGITVDDARSYRPSVAALALNDSMRQLYSSPPLEKALGALFYDEAMSEVMISQLLGGLRFGGVKDNPDIPYTAPDDWAGIDIDDPRNALHFWKLHVLVEMDHSNGVFHAMRPYLAHDKGKEMFQEGVRALERLVEDFWDATTERMGLGHLL